ncbi:MAG: LPD38 domain-containing protein, partial [archaeon]
RYAEFVGQMKATFVDVWEKIKNIVRHIFNEVRKTAEIGKRKLTEEAGTISLEKKAVPEPEVRQPDYKAEADAWIKNYLAKSETAQKEKNLQPLLEGQLEKEIGIKKEMPSKEPDWKNELFGTTKQPRFHKITDAIEDVRNNWRTRIFDRLDPIKTELGEQAYMLHRLETGIQGVMATFMRHGIPRWNGQAITVDTRHKGFLEWYKGLGKDGEGLLYWIAAKRAEQLETEGREQWLTEKERNKIFKSVGDKPVTATSWDELNKQFQRYNKGVLDLAEHSGLINPDAREKWEQHFYVPFYRIFESEITKEEFLKGPVWSKRHIDAQIKRLMGANMKIGDPLENVIRNWTHLIHESMRNMARAEGFNSAQKLGLKTIQKVEKKDLIRVLGSKKQKRYAVMKEGSETASAIFDEKEEAEAWAYHLSDRYNKEYHVSPRVTTSILFGNMKDNNILSFQENGQRTYFKVIDPELFNALSGLNKERFDNIIMKMFRTSKRWLTYGATFGPAFRVRNMFRDTIHTAIISKSFMPFVDSFKGFAKAMREDQDFVKLAASGAAFGSSYVRADDATTLAKYIKRITTKEGEGAIEKILDTPKKLLDWWEKIGSASENAARVSLYAQRIKEGREHLEAAFEARDLLDFTMQGDAGVVQFLIQALPFANARMQGLYKLGRAAGGNPTGFIIKGGILTAASLMLWALNHDKDEWKELEDWEKWTYYHFWVGNNHYRIPKPFEVGAIFSSLFETTADTMTKDEEIQFLGRYIQYTFQDTFAMNPMPQLVRPLIEQWANKSFFTGRPIEGEFLKGLKPGERKDVWTSKTMQELGAIGIPPKRAEELIRGYFSTFGMFLLGISDSIVSHVGDFPKDPSMRIDHYPLVGSFIREREGATHSKYITRFYDTMNEIDQLVGTINFYKKVGDYKRAQELSLESKESLTIKPSLNKIRKNLSLINAQTKIIYHSTTMTPKEKRKKLDNLIEQRNKYTKQAVELIKKFGNK